MAHTGRGPTDTVVVQNATQAKRLAEPRVELHPGSTLDVDVTLDADDPRRTLTVWMAEGRYLEALADLCKPLDTPSEPDDVDEESDFGQNVAAWRAEQTAALRATCTEQKFMRVVVTLDGGTTRADTRHFHASIEWLGRIPLGARTVDTLRVATAFGDQEETRWLEEPKDIAMSKPIVVGNERFADGHATDELFADTILLPSKGRYVRGERAETVISPMFPPMATGWTEAGIMRDAEGDVALAAHGDVIMLSWEGRHASVDLASIARGSSIAEVKLAAVDKHGDKVHALLAVSTYSRGLPMGGYCGAGVESDLVSVTLGAGLDDVQATPLDSCLQTMTSEETTSPKSKVLTWRRTGFSTGTEQTDCVKYDRAHPEKGVTTFACKAPKT